MAAAFYLAAVLARLRAEVNARWPRRDRTSDGWVGDTSHAARLSDHNPDWDDDGVVRATDTDRDGIDPMALVAAAIAHPSTNYVIFNGSIWSRTRGFRRAVYTGVNKHEHHVHISILHTDAAETSTRPWLATAPATSTVQEDDMVTSADMDEIARRTAATVWGWGLGGWEDPATNKLQAHERLVAIHEVLDRTVWRPGNALEQIRARVTDVIPEKLSDLVKAIWARKVAVRHPQTDEAQEIDAVDALGRAASVVSNTRTAIAAGTLAGGTSAGKSPQIDLAALASELAAALGPDLAEQLTDHLADRLTRS